MKTSHMNREIACGSPWFPGQTSEGAFGHTLDYVCTFALPGSSVLGSAMESLCCSLPSVRTVSRQLMAGMCLGDRACVDSGLQFSASLQVKLHQCPFSGQGAVHASFQLRNFTWVADTRRQRQSTVREK